MSAPAQVTRPGVTVEDAAALLDDAVEAYRDDRPETAARLQAARDRLAEPLRIALVGRVKAGKSTLLNALVGARLAPTDAGECTRVVTVYRHGRIPRVVLHGRDGGTRVLPVRRAGGGLQLDLGGAAPEEVDHLVVEWPSPALAVATVVDTPGLASLTADAGDRTRAFLEAGDGLPGADAVVFLTRQLQPSDVTALSAFQAETAAAPTTLTVLSRADETGSGRLDALHAAEAVARRLSADPTVRAVTSAVLPVAGLLGLAGRTLRHADLVALRSLATADPAAVTAMLLTADRFTRPEAPVPLSVEVRTALLDRLGLFGIRLSVMLVRAGIGDAAELADELLRRSGVPELERLLAVHFTDRGAQLRVAAALHLVSSVLAEVPVAGAGELAERAERLRLAALDLDELDLLARERAGTGPLPAELREEGRRLLGAAGTTPAERLGLPAGTPEEALRTAARAALARWTAAAADPLAERSAADAAAGVVRSCEALVAELEGDWEGSAGGGAEPGAGGAGEERDEGEDEQPG
ncbi:dynamin family protein [Blastococcus sp. SYSU D00820]